jgi:hypothetical protein
MKKVLVAVMVVVIGVMFAVASQAAEDEKVKIKENTSGEIKDATVEKEFKGGVETAKGTLIKETVKFDSYNKDNDTISVIKTDGTVVTRPAKFDHTHRDYILKTYKKNDTITATYDTNLGGAVVATELAK